jgi:hypothetical protein
MIRKVILQKYNLKAKQNLHQLFLTAYIRMPKELCAFKDCKKKLALTSLECKCKKKFCDTHRHYLSHECAYDYKEDAKMNLLKYMSTPIISKRIEAI